MPVLIANSTIYAKGPPSAAVVDGSITMRTPMVLSLTFDHRVTDGAPAAAFLGRVVETLESSLSGLEPTGGG
jgi:pyruvate/2-oxoglutarate dehydrogenase complex dihydrolipoamide acyltransferase (E2) component